MRDAPLLPGQLQRWTMLLAAALVLVALARVGSSQEPPHEHPETVTLEGEHGELRMCPQGVGDGATVVSRASAGNGRALRVGHVDCQVGYTAPVVDGHLGSVTFYMTGNGGSSACGRWQLFVDLALEATSESVCADHGVMTRAAFPADATLPGRGFRLAWQPVAPTPEWANGVLDSFDVGVTTATTVIEGETGSSEGLPCSGEGADVLLRSDASGGHVLRLGHDGCHAAYALGDAGFVRGVRLAVSGNAGDDVCARLEIVEDGSVAGWTRDTCLAPHALVHMPLTPVTTLTGDFDVHWRTTNSPTHVNVLIDAIYVDTLPDIVRVEGESGERDACSPESTTRGTEEASGDSILVVSTGGCRATLTLPQGSWFARTVRWQVQRDTTGCTGWVFADAGRIVGGTPQLCPASAGEWHVADATSEIVLEDAFEVEWNGDVPGGLDYVDVSSEPPTP